MLSAQDEIKIQAVSPIYETAPLGGPKQGPFLNACALLETALPPEELLEKIQEIENALGRVREERWGPRLIDLDILTYENCLITTPTLELPHPWLAERDFVLIPLFDIAPELFISGINKTVHTILSNRDPSPDVKLFMPSGWHEES